jgi:uncharacterized RDD family membrane protein YckC
MPLIEIETPFNIDLEFEVAEAHKRLVAYLIDFSILLMFFMSMKYFYYGGFGLDNIEMLKSYAGIDILTISVPMLLYSLVCEVTMNGQTFGKKLLDIRVVSLDGGEPDLSQYIVRWMFKAFEWPFFFGYTIFSLQSIVAYILITGFWGVVVLIFIAINKRNQRLGDIAANTVVVNTQSPFSIRDTIFVNVDRENYTAKYPEVLKLSDRDINTIKSVINLYYMERNSQICERLTARIEQVLNIRSDMKPIRFLEKLLADYNYLATA